MDALHHPLYWPDGFPRTPPEKRVHLAGCRDFVTARNMAISEVHALGGYRLVLSCLVGARSMRWGDPAVALYFRLRWPDGHIGSYVLAADRYTKLSCNLMAIAEQAREIRHQFHRSDDPRRYLAQWETSPSDGRLADMEADDVMANRTRDPHVGPFGPFGAPPPGSNPFTSGSARARGQQGRRRTWMPGPDDFVHSHQQTARWWSVLGLKRRPKTLREAEKAYRKLVLEHHPDRNPGASEQKMREINEAIEQARDQMRR